MRIDNFEVCIRQNGIPLEEYEDEANTSEASKSAKYIKATSGTNFSIYVTAANFYNIEWPAVACVVQLDGRTIDVLVLETQRGSNFFKYDVQGPCGIENGRPVMRRFQFGDLPTNDSSATGAKVEDFKHLGEISVRLLRCRRLGLGYGEVNIRALDNGGVVPEKCLKGRAISNRAALGDSEPMAAAPKTCPLKYEEPRKPFAHFLFKYRSHRDLQIEGLIPRSPSPPAPVPLEERDEDSLSPEEARELIRRMRSKENETKVKIKTEKRTREDTEDDEDDDVTITDQRSSKRARSSTDSGIEVIDLCDDDD